ncbi:MAG: DUF3786 domain-containing protein [Chloroflexi bacterium]|nr:DUF3786 domain-containing protein [Chloroflexota bacterium]
MENKPRVPLPEPRNYGDVFNLASEQLAGINDIEEQCRKTGAHYRIRDSQPEIIIQYLNRPYLLTLPDAKVAPVGSDEEVPLRDRILILHYFISAKGTPAANKLITFRELPEGSVYFPTFYLRTIKPLLDRFAKEPRLLLETGEKLGGHRADYGDTAVTILAFSRVPITIILWRGDDELSPQGNILFDATIADYLPTEDITVLCEVIIWKLIRSLG